MPDSGEGRWTVTEAIDLNISAPVITESLIRRLRSREENNFTDRMISIMRGAFGGHDVKENLSQNSLISISGPTPPPSIANNAQSHHFS